MSDINNLLQKVTSDKIVSKPLHEIATYSQIKVEASVVDKNNYIGVENLLPDKQGKISSTCVPTKGKLIGYMKDDILIGNIRPYFKKIWFADCDGGTNGDVLVIHVKDTSVVLPKYLYYVLSSDDFFKYDVQYSKGSKMPRGSKEHIMKYPIPSLEVQHEIVQKLDILERLTMELKEQLKAEISAVDKQYEYYKNKLLNLEN